jgi:hypothetical protein
MEKFMKSSFLRPALALAVAFGLAACGGGKASFEVRGTVTGLVYSGLVLSNNGTDVAVAPPGKDTTTTSFKFPNSIDYGVAYAVKVKENVSPQQPSNPLHQTCIVNNGVDTAGRLATIDISVTCVVNAFTIGGTITGLTGDGLQLTNGTNGGTVTVAKDAKAFTFGAPVTYNVTYGVSVLTQPKGQTCSVSPNGTGTMQDAAVSNIAVTCTTP